MASRSTPMGSAYWTPAEAHPVSQLFASSALLHWLARLLAAALLASALPAAAQDVPKQVQPSARVVRNVVVRAEASTDSIKIDKLDPGQRVDVESEVPGWYQIRLPDGRKGFVSKLWTEELDAAPPEPLVAQGYKVHVIDVGTGLAVFIEGPGFTMIYDGGSQDDLAMGARNRILAYIAKVRPDVRVIDHLVLSHPHKDHLELLPDVFDRFQVRNVWESGRVNKTAGYCNFLQKVAAEPGLAYHDAIADNATRTVAIAGTACNGGVVIRESSRMTEMPIPLAPGAQMTILTRDPHPYSDPNGNSVVVRLDLGGRKILLAGDAEGGDRDPPSTPPRANSIEGKLLQCCRAELKADVLVVGHHGSMTSSRVPFLDAVDARTFVISSGPFPYQSQVLPDEEVITELSGRGQVLRTDTDDRACKRNAAKIGPDNDNAPGGCDNVRILVDAGGAITADYYRVPD